MKKKRINWLEKSKIDCSSVQSCFQKLNCTNLLAIEKINVNIKYSRNSKLVITNLGRYLGVWLKLIFKVFFN